MRSILWALIVGSLLSGCVTSRVEEKREVYFRYQHFQDEMNLNRDKYSDEEIKVMLRASHLLAIEYQALQEEEIESKKRAMFYRSLW
jgi:hypothetical protein